MDLFVWIYYVLPIWVIVATVIISILIVGLLGRLCSRSAQNRTKAERVFRNICLALFFIYLAFVLWYTVFGRSPGDKSLNLKLFYRFSCFSSSEAWRGYIMNAMLFWPLGMFAVWLFKGSKLKKIVFTIGAAFLLSFCIELAQYVFGIGTAELDDVICNTVGAAIGSLSVLLQ